MRREVVKRVAGLAALAWALALGVGAFAQPGTGSNGRVPVVATTPQVADLVALVGGDRIRLTRLLAPSADPHDHELRPSDVRAIGDARLVVRSGGDVDAWVLDAAPRPPLSLLAHVRADAGDPHWWQDPRNALAAVAAIRDALTRADPSGADDYATGARRASARLRALDAAIARCWEAVAPSERTLVTSHDAYGYYARRYGIRVLGSVIPSLSSHAQPSAGELSSLVAAIRRERVRAIFPERALNPELERAIAREAGAAVGRPLFGDTLGSPGSGGDTYLRALRADTRALVDGLAGRRVACAIPA